MKKNILVSLALFLIFVLSGCGSNSKTNEAVQSTTVAVEMESSQIALGSNGTDFSLPLTFTKLLDSSYQVELSDFQLSVTGCTVQTVGFDPATLVLDGGLNTQEALLVTGAFDQNCTPTGFTLTATQKVTKDGQSKTEEVTFSSTSSEDIPTSGYDIINATTPLTIGESNTDYTISMQVVKDGYVAPGETVKLKPFNSQYGTIKTTTTYTVTTDAIGIARFDYVSPGVLPADGTSVVLTAVLMDENDSEVATQEIELIFNKNGSADITYTIVPDQNITVTDTLQLQQIKVALTKQESGQPVQPAVGESVIAEFMMPVYGTLAQYEAVVGSDGFAKFSYTSPESMPSVNDANITFYYKNDHTVRGETKVIFDKQTVSGVSKMYVVPESFTVTEAGQTQEITIVTVNAENMGVSTEVELEQPFFDNTDYGKFDKTSVTTDASGKAVVLYTAPGSISGLTERNITVTETSENIHKELNIKFGTPETQGTNYEIVVDTPASLAVDDTDQITVKIVEVGNPSNVIANDNVYEVNLTSQFTNMLTFAGGSATYTYEELGTKAIAVETKTLSGVAVIAISASVNNGDHDVVLTKLIPVTVLSGPVTAISLFYVGSSENEVGAFINTYTIHAVDKYANPAREGVVLSPSLINGVKLVETDSSPTGQITAGTPVTFEDSTKNFDVANITAEDRLIVVPNAARYAQSYLGNWSIEDVAQQSLTLSEDYFGATADSLSYVIGNETRSLLGYIALASITSKTGSYVTDANGNVQFDIAFDPALAGHTVTIAAHAYDTNRTGVAKVAGLRWSDYSSTVEKVDNDGNDHNVTLMLGISDFQEYLVDVEIVPEGIVSSSSQCDLNLSAANDLHTDVNGQITVQIYTKATDPAVTECEISWSKSNSHIYLEY
ncbi:MAG: hypothetical protein QG564_967 [Campylobacterota bacterium]|nr:hypothetical protein [Campylobacterota bacterium]